MTTNAPINAHHGPLRLFSQPLEGLEMVNSGPLRR